MSYKTVSNLFWPLWVASLILDGYAVAVMQESAFYGAACVSACALIAFMADEGEQ